MNVSDSSVSRQDLVLLTGATGYVGGRLRRIFETKGQALRCLVRRPEQLEGRFDETTEKVQGDVLDLDSLRAAMKGVHTAYYLVHSMGSQADFAQADRKAAENFATAAAEAGVQRIIYLGGLGRSGEGDLSHHLSSRHEVGRLLRESPVKTIELRSSIILGSGSLSFELIRALVDRLPIMTTPKWVQVKTQPIAIGDVLEYLLQARDVPLRESRVVEIGGPDQVSYGDIMREYATQRGLKRWLIPLPVLSPRISSLWLGLITPIYARIGRELIDSVRNETLVHDQSHREHFDVQPRSMSVAIAEALRNEDRDFAETWWCDALSSRRSKPSYGGEVFGSRVVDSRAVRVRASAEQAFRPVRRIGGTRGWYYANWLWKLRGFIDLLVGGVGVRRGRRNAEWPAVGEALDFWRVESVVPHRLLRLEAEMKVPGRAWLQFEVQPEGEDSILRQTALFKPRGLFGLAYWYALYPIHSIIFAGMLRNIAAAALQPDPVPGRDRS